MPNVYKQCLQSPEVSAEPPNLNKQPLTQSYADIVPVIFIWQVLVVKTPLGFKQRISILSPYSYSIALEKNLSNAFVLE